MHVDSIFKIVLFVACFSLDAVSRPATAQLTSSDKDAIEWFDKLSFPTLEKAPCVRVATGTWTMQDDGTPENDFIIAFLVQDEEDAFSVSTLDLYRRTFSKSKPASDYHRIASFETRELASVAAEQLAKYAAPGAAENAKRRFAEHVSERVETFVLARVCAAQNLDAEAHELIKLAALFPTKKSNLIDALEEEIGHAMMWRAILDFGDPSIQRPKLLETFEKICERYPNSPHVERARDTVDILEEMVDEEKHRVNQKPRVEMTKQELIAELIFELRDQNGEQRSQPGWCDIFADPRGEQSPAAQLRNIGYDAIPQLIDAIKDHRFTRCVGYHRDFYFSHHVLCVGECAETIICHIAQRSFRGPKSEDPEPEVRQWFDEVQKKGIKQVLIEAVSGGDENAPHQALRLIKEFPDEALGAIREGLSSCQKDYVRSRLVEVLCRLRGDSVTELLKNEMMNARDGESRINAARGLYYRDQKTSIQAMSKEWKSARFRENSVNTRDLIDFLAASGTVEAIETLETGLSQRSVDARLQVVMTLGERESMPPKFNIEFDEQTHDSDELSDPVPEVEAAVEKLLVASLSDIEARLGMSGSTGRVEYANPRICDMAALSLSQRFRAKYNFDFSTPMHERDIQLIKIQNTWRRENNLELLLVPAQMLRVNPGLPDDVTKPLLAKIASATNEEERRQSIAEMEKLGLNALPAVRNFSETLPLEHASRAELAALSSRLANIVADIVLEANEVPLDESIKQRMDKLKDKPLDAKAFTELLTDFARELPTGAVGVALTAYRFNDDTGLRLTVQFRQGELPSKCLQEGWSTNQVVEANNFCVHNSSGSSTYDYRLKVSSYEDLMKTMDKALTAPANVHVRVSVSLHKH